MPMLNIEYKEMIQDIIDLNVPLSEEELQVLAYYRYHMIHWPTDILFEINLRNMKASMRGEF
jgi:hypothetical protein